MFAMCSSCNFSAASLGNCGGFAGRFRRTKKNLDAAAGACERATALNANRISTRLRASSFDIEGPPQGTQRYIKEDDNSRLRLAKSLAAEAATEYRPVGA